MEQDRDILWKILCVTDRSLYKCIGAIDDADNLNSKGWIQVLYAGSASSGYPVRTIQTVQMTLYRVTISMKFH